MKIRLVNDPDGVWAAASPAKRVLGLMLSILFLLPMIALLALMIYAVTQLL
ncbi:hypothetical protein BH24CHL5_BH24CHL5_03100 [soil metagenome]